MPHINPELLQQYLADAVDPGERRRLEEHISECADCSNRLAGLVADDLFLSDALALTAEETAWAENQDLAAAVVRQIAPRASVSPIFVVAGLAMLPGVWMLNGTAVAFAESLTARGPIDLTFDLSRAVIPAFGRFLLWMSEGGLLAEFWPLILLAAVFWFWRLSHTKETNEYA